jgi:hypothetical protein
LYYSGALIICTNRDREGRTPLSLCANNQITIKNLKIKLKKNLLDIIILYIIIIHNIKNMIKKKFNTTKMPKNQLIRGQRRVGTASI